MLIEVDDLQNGYLEIINKISNYGSIVSPRGVKTVEIMAAHIVFEDPSKVIPVGIGRNLNTAIGAAESLQFLAGISDAGQLVRISPNFSKFVVNHRFPGAYGPRTAAQFLRLIKLFVKDRDTRQGEIIIWRPWELANDSPDVPCTTGITFFIRNNKLDMMVNMRSNDVFWGLAYDAWVFANAQQAIATALDIEVGRYHHFAGSLHLYVDRDNEAISKLHPVNGEVKIPPLFTSSLKPYGTNSIFRWGRITEWARRCLRTPRRSGGDLVPPCAQSMKWYYERLIDYPSIGKRCAICRYVLPNINQFFRPGNDKNKTRCVCRECGLARKRGTSREHIEALRFMQDKRCAICGRIDRELVLDHDHETGIPRGFLCRPCNVALGIIGEKNLALAINYLTESSSRSRRVRSNLEEEFNIHL